MWGCDEAEIPGKGIPAQEIIEAIHAGEIKGLLSICFNPAVSAPDTNFTAEAFDELEFYAVIDFFLSESAHHADVVLPGLAARGGRGHLDQRRGADHQDQRRRRAARRGPARLGDPPRHRRRLGRGQYFPYRNTEEIFEELRVASAGGTADYAGATWERIEDEMGLFWPIPEDGHPGTPRLFEGGRFYHPDGKARFHGVPFQESAEVVDDEYPIWLTTGRVVSQYLSGTQTRRIAGSSSSTPSRCARCTRASPSSSASPTATSSRSPRGAARSRCRPASSTTIRPDTVFIPYHWPGAKAANQLTNRAVDPVSKMPEFKVAAVRVARATRRRRTRHDPRREYGIDDAPVFVIDQSRCIGCEACVQACMECGTHRGQSLIHLERIDRSTHHADRADGVHALRGPDLRRGVPGRRHQADRGRASCSRRSSRAASAARTACSPARSVCPSTIAEFDQMMKCDMCTDRTSEGLKPMCASVCPSEALWYGTIEEFDDTRRGSLLRDFLFGRQDVRTKVYTVVDDLDGGPLDVARPGTTASWLDDPVRPRSDGTG